MSKVMFLLAFFVVLGESGCDQQKQDVRISALEGDVKQLKADVDELKEKQKSEHHYELRNEGLRTWRFDPATGDLCIQLTSEADWKRKDTKSQSCLCVDERRNWIEMPKGTDAQNQSAQSYYDYAVKPACWN